MLASIVINIDDDYDDLEDQEIAIKAGLEEIVRTVSRVLLLHARWGGLEFPKVTSFYRYFN